jgi:hypothetical protein
MCCFTQAVDHVSDTSIFARGVNGRQVIVYSMAYAAQSDLAMVLPLPVPLGSSDAAVRFISLEEYPEFFAHMERAFPRRELLLLGKSVAMAATGVERVPLVVYEVGHFDASFVPSLKDFDRLDPRFRIPHTVWDELPAYQHYGFAVFKLKASTRGVSGDSSLAPEGPTRKVHPMAFECPRRQPGLLYFPTVHVHDRTAVRVGACSRTKSKRLAPDKLTLEPQDKDLASPDVGDDIRGLPTPRQNSLDSARVPRAGCRWPPSDLLECQ